MRRIALWVLLMTACDGDASRSASPESEAPAETATAETDPDEAQVEPAGDQDGTDEGTATGPEGRPIERTLRAEDHETIRAAIRAGRAATRAGNLAEALAHFDRALALNPRDAGLHCEAGFAAVNGHSDEERRYAREHLEEGLALLGPGEPPPALRVPKAMCLYNYGLLAERAERWDRAATYFSRSLALRPNATVQRHLEAVRAGAAAQDDLERAPSLAALVERWNGEVDDEERDSDTLTYELGPTFPGEGAQPELGLIRFREWRESGTLLAVAVPGGYQTTPVASGIEGGGLNASGTAVEAVHRAAPGWVRLELTTTTFTSWQDTVEGPEEGTFCDLQFGSMSGSSELGLCRLGPPLRCRAAMLAPGDSGEDCEAFCDEPPPRSYEREVCGELREPGSGYALTVEADPTRGLRLTLARGEAPDEPPLPISRWVSFAEAFEELHPMVP